MVFPSRLTRALIGLVVLSTAAHAKNYRVIVGAAEVDRAGQVVTFSLPADAKVQVARDGKAVLPLQVESDGKARFIVPLQKAGEIRTFRLEAGTGQRSTESVEAK